MKDLLILLAHLLTTVAKLLGPGGARAIVADSLLMKQQLLVIHRSRRRAPNLAALDRFLFGLWSLFLNPRRIQRAAIIIRPSTLLKFHDLLKKRKYRLLYSSSRKGKPGPKGPSPGLIQAIVELKRRNPRFGCLRIAQQINKAFGIDIDKDIVRRVLAAHYRPGSNDDGPSWLSLLGQTKDSLWSIDLFRCESINLISPSRTPQCRIPSLSDSLERYDVNTSTVPSFGIRWISNENSTHSYIITTMSVFISLWTETHRAK